MEVSGQIHVPAALPCKSLWYKGLVISQSVIFTWHSNAPLSLHSKIHFKNMYKLHTAIMPYNFKEVRRDHKSAFVKGICHNLKSIKNKEIIK
jgi:hypothetical protein